MRLDHLLSKEDTEQYHDVPKKVDLSRLFNFEGTQKKIWGFSSAGRAPALQAGGQGFDSLNLHQISLEDFKCWRVTERSLKIE